jgi:glycogen(starch) synthase
MRVLCVGVRYPPHHTGGYELHCRSVVEDLRAHGHEVHVLTSTLRHPEVPDGDEPRVRRELRAFDPRAPWPGWRAAHAGERANVRALRAALARVRPDVVCWWRMGELSLALVEHVRRAGLPAVGVVCDRWLLEGPVRDPWQRPWLEGRRGRPLVERATRLPVAVDWSGAATWLFVSDWLRRETLATGPPLGRTGVAHAGIDPERLVPRGAAPPWRGRLLYAGRLSELKGADDAVCALAALPGTLTVCGHGSPEDHARLRATARDAGVEGRVELLGAVGAAGMPAVYAEHDALLFPSRWEEPWGLVPLEAMAVGLPVVATGTGGSAEYLRAGENALRVAPEDPAGLAAAARALAEGPELRARLVAGGLATAARFPTHACDAVVREALAAAAERSGRATARVVRHT